MLSLDDDDQRLPLLSPFVDELLLLDTAIGAHDDVSVDVVVVAPVKAYPREVNCVLVELHEAKINEVGFGLPTR
jgi:hypothetical protein